MKMKKDVQYAGLLLMAIGQIFDEDNENYIDPEELMEGDNLTDFFHALANSVPTHFFNKFTGADKNQLEFNHTANQLCFQYSNKIDKEKEQDDPNE